jgi:hypothetical protein
MRYQTSLTTMYCCKQTYTQHLTNLLQITEELELPATCSYTQQDKTWVEHASWLEFIPLCLVAYYIFLRTFHFSLSSSSLFPQEQDSTPQTQQPGVIESESSQKTDALSNAPLALAQRQRRHQLVHHDATIAPTENMAQDTQLKKVRKTGGSKNWKPACDRMWVAPYQCGSQSTNGMLYCWGMLRAPWPMYRCPEYQTSKVDERICPHSP